MIISHFPFLQLLSLLLLVDCQQELEEDKYYLPPVTEYPYVVAVMSKIKVCTGVIVNQDWVLTAAHCLYNEVTKQFVDNNMVKIVASSADYEKQDKDSVERTSVEIKAHPDFKYNTLAKYDVALVKVKRPFVWGPKLSNITVSGQGWPQSHKKGNAVVGCFTLGYGGYMSTAPPTKTLKASKNLTAVHAETSACSCSARYQYKRLVCVRQDKEHAKMCQGDDGGPLVCGGKLVAIGHMVRNRRTCATPTYPREKCKGNPSPGLDIYYFLCPVQDWLRMVVADIPVKPKSCRGSKLHDVNYSVLILLAVLLVVLRS